MLTQLPSINHNRGTFMRRKLITDNPPRIDIFTRHITCYSLPTHMRTFHNSLNCYLLHTVAIQLDTVLSNPQNINISVSTFITTNAIVVQFDTILNRHYKIKTRNY